MVSSLLEDREAVRLLGDLYHALQYCVYQISSNPPNDVAKALANAKSTLDKLTPKTESTTTKLPAEFEEKIFPEKQPSELALVYDNSSTIGSVTTYYAGTHQDIGVQDEKVEASYTSYAEIGSSSYESEEVEVIKKKHVPIFNCLQKGRSGTFVDPEWKSLTDGVAVQSYFLTNKTQVVVFKSPQDARGEALLPVVVTGGKWYFEFEVQSKSGNVSHLTPHPDFSVGWSFQGDAKGDEE
jgi:hypothetical protein